MTQLLLPLFPILSDTGKVAGATGNASSCSESVSGLVAGAKEPLPCELVLQVMMSSRDFISACAIANSFSTFAFLTLYKPMISSTTFALLLDMICNVL